MSEEIYDQAAQFERTALSLNRTLLALAANGALLLKAGGSTRIWVTILGAVILLACLVAWTAGNRAYRHGRGKPAGSLLRNGSAFRTLTMAAVAIGVIDIAVILTR